MQDGKLSNLEALRSVWSKDCGLSAIKKAVLNVLVGHRNQKTGRCNPGQPLVAAEAGVTVRGLQKLLIELEQAGIVERKNEVGKLANYVLHLDRLPPNHVQGYPRTTFTPEPGSGPEPRSGVHKEPHTRTRKEVTDKQKDSPNGESVYSKRASKIWRDRMGGTAPRVRINVALRPLVVEHGAAEVLKWWDKYLANPKTGAQFKNPQDFASRFGAWIAEQSKNGCSVEDIRRCLHIGGSMLSMQVSRESAFETIREIEPALWERVKDVLPRLDYSYLLGKTGFELDRAIKSRLESHD